MNKFLLSLLAILSMSSLFAQQKLYDEQADAMQQIEQAVQRAQQDNKYVFCQVGGNWCPWCLRFAAFVESDTTVNQLMNQNFEYIHVNWSKENKNPETMKYLGNPARFGFPVFVILNEEGEPIHIQNSAYLEQDKGYSEAKVVDFLKAWTPEAVKALK